MQIVLRLNTDTSLGDVAARAYALPNPDPGSAARTRAQAALTAANTAVLERGRQSLIARGLAAGDGLGGVPLGTLLVAPPLTGPAIAFSPAAAGNPQFADGEVQALQRALTDATAAFQADAAAEAEAIYNTAQRFNATNPQLFGPTKALIDTTAPAPTGVSVIGIVAVPPPLQAYEINDLNFHRTALVPQINRQAILDRRVRLDARITDFNARITALQADLTTLLARFGQ